MVGTFGLSASQKMEIVIEMIAREQGVRDRAASITKLDKEIRRLAGDVMRLSQMEREFRETNDMRRKDNRDAGARFQHEITRRKAAAAALRNQQLQMIIVQHRMAKGVRKFRSEFLSLMFAGMALQRVFSKYIETVKQMLGITDLISTVMTLMLLPVFMDLLPWIMRATEWFLNLSEGQRKAIGWFMILVTVFGTLLLVLSQAMLFWDGLVIVMAGTSNVAKVVWFVLKLLRATLILLLTPLKLAAARFGILGDAIASFGEISLAGQIAAIAGFAIALWLFVEAAREAIKLWKQLGELKDEISKNRGAYTQAAADIGPLGRLVTGVATRLPFLGGDYVPSAGTGEFSAPAAGSASASSVQQTNNFTFENPVIQNEEQMEELTRMFSEQLATRNASFV